MTNPVLAWMEQIARNLTAYEDGFLMGKRFLIIDRDCIFSPAFKSTVASSGVEILLTAYQAPNMNAHAERFIRSIEAECLDQMILVSQRSLDRAIKEFVGHFSTGVEFMWGSQRVQNDARGDAGRLQGMAKYAF